jgi:hypothetical protein
MKRIALLVSLFTLGLPAASIALADPGHGNGPPSGKGNAHGSQAACRPTISIILKGLYVSGSADATGAGSFTMDVKRANHHGKALAGTQATITVDSNTKYRRNGHAKLSDFLTGDRLKVQVRACKQTSGTPALLAKRIVGHAATTGGDETTSTETETTETTTTTP